MTHYDTVLVLLLLLLRALLLLFLFRRLILLLLTLLLRLLGSFFVVIRGVLLSLFLLRLRGAARSPPVRLNILRPRRLQSRLHHRDVFARRGALIVKLQSLLHLLLELLPERVRLKVAEAVDARSDAALIREISADSTLVTRMCFADKTRVENQAVLGGVPLGLQRAEQSLLGAENLNSGRGILRQVRERTGVRDETSRDDVADESSEVGGDLFFFWVGWLFVFWVLVFRVVMGSRSR